MQDGAVNATAERERLRPAHRPQRPAFDSPTKRDAARGQLVCRIRTSSGEGSTPRLWRRSPEPANLGQCWSTKRSGQHKCGSSTFLMGRAADGKAPKSEIRNPKEGRSPKSEKPAKRLGSGYVLQFQKTSAKTRQCRQQRIRIRASDFGLLSDFGFRASDFCPVVSVTLRAESMLPTTNVEEPLRLRLVLA